MNEIETTYFNTDFGELILGSYKDALCLCDWRYRKKRGQIDSRIRKGVGASYKEGLSTVTKECMLQLQQYFSGERMEFDLPLLTIGSDFQKQVWEKLKAIPYGKTETYLSLSKQLENEKAIRAVAAANGANAISIIIPCHRIIGSDGNLVGYAGGLGVKKKLLKLEKALDDSQLSLF